MDLLCMFANLMNGGEYFVNCDTSAYMNKDFNYFGVVCPFCNTLAPGYSLFANVSMD